MAEQVSTTQYRMPLLMLGAVVGLLVAAAGMVELRFEAEDRIPPGYVAKIGDTLIADTRYYALLDDLRADKRGPLSDQDRQFALDRLIDEELLIQRGVELGVAEVTPAVRKAIASEVISHVVTSASAKRPNDVELRQFYESAEMYFATPGRQRLRWWRLKVPASQTRQELEELERRIGESVNSPESIERFGFQLATELPDTLLPPRKLLDYIGPALLEHVETLQPGEFSNPISEDRVLHVLYLVERVQESAPTFETVKEMVEQEYMYRESDDALRAYVAWLRERSTVTTADLADLDP